MEEPQTPAGSYGAFKVATPNVPIRLPPHRGEADEPSLGLNEGSTYLNIGDEYQKASPENRGLPSTVPSPPFPPPYSHRF